MTNYKFLAGPRTWLNGKVENLGNAIYEGLGDTLASTLFMAQEEKANAALDKYEQLFAKFEGYRNHELSSLPKKTNRAITVDSILKDSRGYAKAESSMNKSHYFLDKMVALGERISEMNLNNSQMERFNEIRDKPYKLAKQLMTEDKFGDFVDQQMGW